MEANARQAARLKDALSRYLDACIAKGKEPRLSEIVSACEPSITNRAFGNGYRAGGAVDAD
jgi:hypothetical protein